MISLDTEATGLDLRHGARPFLVTICNEDQENTFWEWPVNPKTRKPQVPKEDLLEIQRILRKTDRLVLQNPKFDYLGLRLLYQDHWLTLPWDWSKVYDTLLAGHLLRSSDRHDLSTMALAYLRVNIDPYEKDMEKAVKGARSIGKGHGWRIAQSGLPEMPSAKGKVWKYDSWMPRAAAKLLEYKKDHPWWRVTSLYANVDSAVTLALFQKQESLLKKKGLWKIYQARRKLLPIVCDMEDRGVTLSEPRLRELQGAFGHEVEKASRICVNIAKSYGHELELPKGASTNNSLRTFVFDVMKLPVKSRSKKTGAPSMDRRALEDWAETLPPRSKPAVFIQNLLARRKRGTALQYMEGYERFWLPLDCGQGWRVLHPSLNPTGTNTLRWSSQNPNEQNISKQKGFNLRYCFGPTPGREWWSLDAANIELRIPAYEAGEEEMIAIFEKPDDPPYYGSYHLLVFDLLHPKRFAKHGTECKSRYKSTWYQWTKNGNFAVQYGSVESSGTADRAYHVPGAFGRIKRRFKKLHGPNGLNARMIKQAEETGCVETMPDKTVDRARGYPLWCTRTSYGRILPTVPLNYHVQGTACWWMMKAMIRVQKYLDQLNSIDDRGFYMIMQVHDELVFDFPRGRKQNLPIVRKIQRLMERGGDDIGIPTPVSIEYHPETWSEWIAI